MKPSTLVEYRRGYKLVVWKGLWWPFGPLVLCFSARSGKWRKCMGIEPTRRVLYTRRNGFEDREAKRTTRHDYLGDYSFSCWPSPSAFCFLARGGASGNTSPGNCCTALTASGSDTRV